MAESPPKATPEPRSTRKVPPVTDKGLTPAMRQYVEQKQRVGEAILLFRMGDFYETFYDDAVLCARVLGIALTARNKGENPIPLAGIPYHALESYLRKLVDAGYKVAISEQMEDPRTAKGVVKREIVRVVTAGTLTDDALLDQRSDNTLAAICFAGEKPGLAMVELAGGRFEVFDVSDDSLLDELVRLRPAELLIDDEIDGKSRRMGNELRTLCGTSITPVPLHEFSEYQAERTLLEHFETATLAGFGFEEMTPSLRAAGALIGYLKDTQKTTLAHIVAVRKRVTSSLLQIDHNSWRSLEIERTLRSGEREGTLLHAIDRTVNPIGARRLRRFLREPLTDEGQIIARQDVVQFYLDNDGSRRDVRERLKAISDMERVTARVALRRAGPRDLAGLGNALRQLPALIDALRAAHVGLLRDMAEGMEGLDEPARLITQAIVPDPPPNLRDGNVIADGFDAELDRLRGLRRDGQGWLARYQQQEIERTGIQNLKVGFNRVFGYYIEVSHAARDKVPDEYVRRQTVKNAERYITDELKKHETEVLGAEEKALGLEVTLFERVRGEVARYVPQLLRVADGVGLLDALTGLAELAEERRYVRPESCPDRCLEIRDGRHPVLDRVLGDEFVPNDTVMTPDEARLFVITGPNMAGKSTYIRQVALLVLLAQTGSFVPARSMRWSIVDRIFARVGAADEIMRGQSTFMVEMTEAANILHNATERSLVVLDELGRGTSTFDGLSLAWAISEYLAREIGCRALVATHYHELTELAELLSGVRNYNVAVREVPDRARRDEAIVFLHRIVEGGASKSYGLHVARLAGIPRSVIERSREVLEELQRGFERESRSPQLARKRTRDDSQLPLFTDPGEGVLEELRSLDVDQITPLEALQRISRWKKDL